MARFDGKVALITGAASPVEGELMGFGGRADWPRVLEGGAVGGGDLAERRGWRGRSRCGRRSRPASAARSVEALCCRGWPRPP